MMVAIIVFSVACILAAWGLRRARRARVYDCVGLIVPLHLKNLRGGEMDKEYGERD